VEYHAGLDRILVHQVENGTSGALLAFNPADQTSSILVGQGTGLLDPSGDPHNICIYNSISDVAVFGGGNGVQSLWKIDGAGTVTQLTNIPGALGNIGPGTGNGTMFANPVTGGFVAASGPNNWYDLDIAGSGTWTPRGDTADVYLSPTPAGAAETNGTVSCPIPEYGIVLFIKAYSGSSPADMWIWKI